MCGRRPRASPLCEGPGPRAVGRGGVVPRRGPFGHRGACPAPRPAHGAAPVMPPAAVPIGGSAVRCPRGPSRRVSRPFAGGSRVRRRNALTRPVLPGPRRRKCRVYSAARRPPEHQPPDDAPDHRESSRALGAASRGGRVAGTRWSAAAGLSGVTASRAMRARHFGAPLAARPASRGDVRINPNPPLPPRGLRRSGTSGVPNVGGDALPGGGGLEGRRVKGPRVLLSAVLCLLPGLRCDGDDGPDMSDMSGGERVAEGALRRAEGSRLPGNGV